MRYICCQPANDYYLWQIETVINNFMSHGINPNQIDIVLGYNNEDLTKWKILQEHHNTIRFFFYKDTRENSSYIPAIYFNLMKQHLASNPALKDEVLFLHMGAGGVRGEMCDQPTPPARSTNPCLCRNTEGLTTSGSGPVPFWGRPSLRGAFIT